MASSSATHSATRGSPRRHHAGPGFNGLFIGHPLCDLYIIFVLSLPFHCFNVLFICHPLCDFHFLSVWLFMSCLTVSMASSSATHSATCSSSFPSSPRAKVSMASSSATHSATAAPVVL